MAMWQDWFQKGTEAWTKVFNAPAANGNADVASKSREMFDSWANAWVKFFSNPPSQDALQAGQQAWRQQMDAWTRFLAGSFQAKSADPTEVWRGMVSAWTESWIKAITEISSPDLRRTAQSIWSEQFETWTNVIAQAMNERPFAAAMAESAEQVLTAQENFQAAIHPQVDATLRLLNIPSRNQVNRLFEEVADVQSRLQALADENLVILRELLNRAPSHPQGE
jgi:hypothetical protein